MRLALSRMFSECCNLTMAGDGWTNARKESVYGFNVIVPTPGRRVVHVVGASDLTIVKHSAPRLAGGLLALWPACIQAAWCCVRAAETCVVVHAEEFMHWLDVVGPQRVVALVTDQAANMKAMRDIVTNTDGYRHILSVR